MSGRNWANVLSSMARFSEGRRAPSRPRPTIGYGSASSDCYIADPRIAGPLADLRHLGSYAEVFERLLHGCPCAAEHSASRIARPIESIEPSSLERSFSELLLDLGLSCSLRALAICSSHVRAGDVEALGHVDNSWCLCRLGTRRSELEQGKQVDVTAERRIGTPHYLCCFDVLSAMLGWFDV
ncbi:hypothetical protein CC78DRAFT_577204 [Lojkania enalia]|uniref:Uncharacterized protein n=1 Tax=Lojkania enalia TaxID=147567 RepID=A0A9P4N7W1_9PLEO|nr:hypothetical protein CC78DRAFT_577204 [Didymosphaeria enalia]